MLNATESIKTGDTFFRLDLTQEKRPTVHNNGFGGPKPGWAQWHRNVNVWDTQPRL